MVGLALVVVVVGVVVDAAAEREGRTKDNQLDYCIDSKYHKHKPGPESNLFDQCTPWKNRSCCTDEVAEQLHQSSIYNFNFNHCAQKKLMSDKCRRHFVQDHCFYECSPNVGPWVVAEARSWRRERFYQVPLCAVDCDAWFQDCADDYTCTDNWARNFDWRNTTVGCHGDAPSCRSNFCPPKSSCQTISEVYRTAENFCQTVWDGSWKYTKSDLCMRLWFDGSQCNPNDGIARHYAHLISLAASLSPLYALVPAALAVLWLMSTQQ